MPIVEKINSLEPEMQKLTDKELSNKTQELKKVNNLEEVFSIINISDYSIAKLNYLVDKVKEANICSTGGFSSASDNKTLENNTIVAICKVKKEVK